MGIITIIFIAAALIYALATILIVKIILAVTLVVLSVKFKKEIKVLRTPDKIINNVKMAGLTHSPTPARGALKDLLRPLFLMSFFLMLIFIWQINGTMAEKIWMALRPLAIGFCLFYLLRSPWVAAKLFEWSKKSEAFGKIYDKSQKAFALITDKYKS